MKVNNNFEEIAFAFNLFVKDLFEFKKYFDGKENEKLTYVPFPVKGSNIKTELISKQIKELEFSESLRKIGNIRKNFCKNEYIYILIFKLQPQLMRKKG